MQNSSSKKKKKKRPNNAKKMHMHNQISHTTFFLRCVFRCLCVLCAMFFAFFVRFLCVFAYFFAFSQGPAQKMPKKNAKKNNANTKQKNAKAKTRTFLIAFVLLFDCIFVAFFVHVCCLFGACFLHFWCVFLHLFSGQMRLFSQLFAFFCIPRHPLVTCFCVFCAFFSGLVLHYVCIVYAFFYVCFAVSSGLALAYIINLDIQGKQNIQETYLRKKASGLEVSLISLLCVFMTSNNLFFTFLILFFI